MISSAGTLVTLLFGLSALATKVQHFKLPTATQSPLYCAAAFLVAAASLGIVTNVPRKVNKTNLSRVPPLLQDQYWDYAAKDAQKEIARTQLEAAQSTREGNHTTAVFLQWAITLEIIGIFWVALAVILLIAND